MTLARSQGTKSKTKLLRNSSAYAASFSDSASSLCFPARFRTRRFSNSVSMKVNSLSRASRPRDLLRQARIIVRASNGVDVGDGDKAREYDGSTSGSGDASGGLGTDSCKSSRWHMAKPMPLEHWHDQ